MKNLLVYFLIFWLTFIPASDAQSLIEGQVTWRNDADTYKVKLSVGAVTEVRLACLDTPEIPHNKTSKTTINPSLVNHFQWGKRSSDRVEQLIPIKSTINILPLSIDYRYGRTVGEVLLKDGTNLGQILVSEGLAQIYDEYINQCPDKAELIALQEKAKISKVGIWGDAQYISPVLARKLIKSGAAKTPPSESLPPIASSVPTTSVLEKNYNCKDFNYQEDAQQVFEQSTDDRYGLDRDKDRIACEGNKKRSL